MGKVYEWAASAYFIAATISLMVIAFVMLVSALIGIATAFTNASVDPMSSVLDGIGLLIIGFAVIETAKFVAEEELFRKRELRSAHESRRSLTKFVTIIVIATSLEALVMVFKTSRNDISQVIYPAVLFMAAMLGQAALGIYQWLSSRIEGPKTGPEERDTP
jgi:putative Mn2+ efflux pump MntP